MNQSPFIPTKSIILAEPRQVLYKYDLLKSLVQKMERIIYNDYSPSSKLYSLTELMEEKPIYEFMWEDWYHEFCEIFPNFYQHMIKRFPDILDEDRKILCMLYIGYTSSEIGDRMCLSPKTVETRKYRFIKKYKIGNQKELRTILSKF